MISPELSNLGASTHRLRFFADASTSTSTIEVGTITDINDPATFTSIQAIAPTTTHAEYTVNFDGYSGSDTYIAIRHIFVGEFDSMDLDDIVWEAIPACLKPTALAATNITATSADLGWTENNSATAWEVKYSDTAGFDPDAAGTLATASSNPYALTGLSFITAYEYYVRSNCGGGDGDSAWWLFSFTTLCGIESAPYVMNFSTSSTPACWTESGS